MNKKDNSEKYFILSAILGGCILISYLVFVIVKNGTQDIAFPSIYFAIRVAGTQHLKPAITQKNEPS